MEKLRDTLIRHGISNDKRYGQNFISDTNLLDAIVSDSGVNKDSTVLEIGVGAATLTKSIAKTAGKLVGIEIDKRLEPAITEAVGSLSNVKIIYGDALKISPAELSEITGTGFDIIANLPYYITSPIIFYFLENDFDLKTMTIMVQKEVADRITAAHNTPDYGALTAAVWVHASARITRIVPRQMFFPQPNVDSAVVRLDMRREVVYDKAKALRLIKCAFSMRRKTLVNNIMKDYRKSREECEDILCRLGIDIRARGESLSPETLCKISEKLQ